MQQCLHRALRSFTFIAALMVMSSLAQDPTAFSPQDVYTVTLSDLANRRGQVQLTSVQTKAKGTICSNSSWNGPLYFGGNAATVVCNQAGVPSLVGGLAIPFFGGAGTPLIQGLDCQIDPLSNNNNISACTSLYPQEAVCPAEENVGVVCPTNLPADSTTGPATTCTGVTMYFYDQNGVGQMTDCITALQNFLGFFGYADLITSQVSVTATDSMYSAGAFFTGPGFQPVDHWYALNFFFFDTLSVSHAKRQDLEYWATALSVNASSWLRYVPSAPNAPFIIDLKVTPNTNCVSFVQATPPPPTGFPPIPNSGGTPSPMFTDPPPATSIPIVPTNISGWQFSLVNGMSSTGGTVVALPPGRTTWGTFCYNAQTTPRIFLTAVCNTLGFQRSDPIVLPPVREGSDFTPIYLNGPYMCPQDNTSSLANCSFSVWTGAGSPPRCTHDDDLAIDCMGGGTTFPPRLFTAVGPLAFYSFMQGQSFIMQVARKLGIPGSFVQITSEEDRGDYSWVSFVFNTSNSFYPFGPSPGTNGSFAFGSGGGGGFPGFGGSMNAGSNQDNNMDLSGYSANEIAAIFAALDANDLLDMNIFELRDNTTTPNGAVSSVPSQWLYSIDSSDLQIASAINKAGRIVLQAGSAAPLGTVCSLGTSNAFALAVCQKVNSPTSVTSALLIPYYRYGRGVIYLSNATCLTCGSYTWSNGTYKNNSCMHMMDSGVLCGTNVVPDLPVNSKFIAVVAPETFNTPNDTVQCISMLTNAPRTRLLVSGYDTSIDPLHVLVYFSVAKSTVSGDWTTGDIGLLLNATNAGAYEHYCGITVILVSSDPVPTNLLTQNPTAAPTTTGIPMTARPPVPATPQPTLAPGQTAVPTTKQPTLAPGQTAVPTTKQPTLAPGQTSVPTTKQPTLAPGQTAAPTTKQPTLAPGQTAVPTTASPPTTSQPSLAPGQTAVPSTAQPIVPTTAQPSLAPGQTAVPTTLQPSLAPGQTAVPITDQPSLAPGQTAVPITDQPSLAPGQTVLPVSTAVPTTAIPPTPKPTEAPTQVAFTVTNSSAVNTTLLLSTLASLLGVSPSTLTIASKTQTQITVQCPNATVASQAATNTTVATLQVSFPTITGAATVSPPVASPLSPSTSSSTGMIVGIVIGIIVLGLIVLFVIKKQRGGLPDTFQSSEKDGATVELDQLFLEEEESRHHRV